MENKVLNRLSNIDGVNETSNFLDYFQIDSDYLQKNKLNTTLEMIDGAIFSQVGKSLNLLNEFTVSAAAQNFVLFLQKNLYKKSIFVTHDGSFNGILFSKVFASVLNAEGVSVYFNYKNKPLNNAMSVFIAENSEVNFDFIVTFSDVYFKKTYHSISFLNKNGLLLDSEKSKKINALISETNFLNLTIPRRDIPTIKYNHAVDEYVEGLKSAQDLSNLNITISNSINSIKGVLDRFLLINNIQHTTIGVDNYKSSKKRANKISRKSILSSLFKSRDIIVNLSNDINEFEFVVRHKKRWKFLTFNDLALLYIHYVHLNKDRNDYKHKYVFYSNNSSRYIDFMSKKEGFKTFEFDSYGNLIEEKVSMKDVLVSTNGQDYFITENNRNFCNDPIMNLKIFLEIASYFKRKKMNLYQVLTSIYKKYGVFYFSSTTENLDYETTMLFFNRLQNSKSINDVKILDIKENKKMPMCYEVFLEDKSIVLIQYFKNRKILLITTSIWSNKVIENRKQHENEYINLVVKSKKIITYLNTFKEKIETKKFSWGALFKYSIFILVFSVLLYVLFEFTLSPGKGGNIWKDVSLLLINQPLFAYLIPVLILGCAFQIVIGCWMSYRILSKLGEKARIRHIFVANFITICISTITPLIYGGESVGYWYLRRKNIKQAPIAAMFLVQSLFTQLNIIIFSIIFLPVGFLRFYDSILKEQVGPLVITLIIIGSVIDVFSAVMISLLTFSSRTTSSIANTLNKFIEWIPFIITRNSNAQGAKLKYEFTNINEAAKQLFTKDAWYKNALTALSFVFYRMVSTLLSWGVIGALIANMLVINTLPINTYFDVLAGGALVRGVNAINFVIPGGLGLSDWAAKNIYPSLFKSTAIKDFADKFYSVDVWQTLNRLMYTIVFAILSAFALLTVFIGESRIDKYNKIKRTLTPEEIKVGNIRVKTRFYSFAIIPWALGLSSVVTAWYLIYNFVLL